ncbi:MAG: hypothetical protein Q7T29_17295, partial [Gallionella sp.]|nr:hypothetical protein [Gallionella sp.]
GLLGRRREAVALYRDQMERGENLIYSNNVAWMQPFDGLRTGLAESGATSRRLRLIPHSAALHTGYSDYGFMRG